MFACYRVLHTAVFEAAIKAPNIYSSRVLRQRSFAARVRHSSRPGKLRQRRYIVHCRFMKTGAGRSMHHSRGRCTNSLGQSRVVLIRLGSCTPPRLFLGVKGMFSSSSRPDRAVRVHCEASYDVVRGFSRRPWGYAVRRLRVRQTSIRAVHPGRRLRCHESRLDQG